MARVAIKGSPAVFGGPFYEERHWEDGEVSVRYDFFVGIEVAAGKFSHPHPFRHRVYAEAFAAKVEAAGSVDLALWVEEEEPEPLEVRWAAEAHREALERMGYRV